MKARCAYQDEEIIRIERGWIKKSMKDRYKANKKIEEINSHIKNILLLLGDNANCRFDAIEGRELCIFHDPDYWKDHKEEIRDKFLEEVKKGERFFVGFHIAIRFPKVINQDLHLELTKVHDILDANDIVFISDIWFTFAEFNDIVSFNKQGLMIKHRLMEQNLIKYHSLK